MISGGDPTRRASWCPHYSNESGHAPTSDHFYCDDCATDYGDYDDPHEMHARENLIASVGPPVVISPQQEVVTDQETLQTLSQHEVVTDQEPLQTLSQNEIVTDQETLQTISQNEIVTDQEALQTFTTGDQNIEVLIPQYSGEMQPLMILSTESLSSNQVCISLFLKTILHYVYMHILKLNHFSTILPTGYYCRLETKPKQFTG